MHPGFYGWWKAQRAAECGPSCGPARDWAGGSCGPSPRRSREPDEGARFASDGGEDPGPFGVKRPLRFLAYKLELSDEQVAGLAAILSDLKTERAQVAVDQRRRISHIADALEGATFDEAKAKDAGALQVEAAERLRKVVSASLAKIHALLDEDQRKRLAYLLRTGALSI